MTRIIGIFDQLTEAQAAASLLAASGLKKDCLSIIGHGSKSSQPQSQLKQSAAWGSALGAAVALMLPHGGILYLAGHLARAAALHVLGMTVKGLVIGAAAGSGMDVLRRAGLDRR